MFIAHGANLTCVDSNGKLPLFYTLSDIKTVKHILDGGFNVDGIIDTSKGRTALHIAVMVKNVNMVEFLLKYKANINVKDNLGKTPLNFAVYNNIPELVKLCLDSGASLEYKDYTDSPLIQAIMQGNLTISKQLIEAGINVNKAFYGGIKVSPLECAVAECQPETVELLLKNGANVNSVNNEDTAILNAMYIFSYSQEEKEKGVKLKKIVEHLLEYNADVNVVGSIGKFPIEIAITINKYDIVMLLLKAGAMKSKEIYLLLSAVHNGNNNAVAMCLDFGEDFNSSDFYGHTPYHAALKEQTPLVLKTFWKYGCPYNQRVKTLASIDLGIDLFIRLNCSRKNDKHLLNQHYFIEAISKNDVKGAEKALENGAEARGCSVNIKSPVHLVSKKGHVEIVKLLLQKGVPVNSVINGDTPLHLAASAGQEKICLLLLQHGACFNNPSLASRKTAKQLIKDQKLKDLFGTVEKMFYMVKHGNSNVVKKLKYYSQNNVELFKALVNSMNHRGLTLMGSALDRGHMKVAEDIMSLKLKLDL